LKSNLALACNASVWRRKGTRQDGKVADVTGPLRLYGGVRTLLLFWR
jgi:hypothetical protein